jgi:hypothetical protein
VQRSSAAHFRNCEAAFVKIGQKKAISPFFRAFLPRNAVVQEPTGVERVNSTRQPENPQ